MHLPTLESAGLITCLCRPAFLPNMEARESIQPADSRRRIQHPLRHRRLVVMVRPVIDQQSFV